jgi:osmotically-inducible protein OsmY
MSQPSDLVRRVKNRLSGQSIPSLREIDVEASGDLVVLRGRVQNFHQWQVAMTLCKHVAGVRGVRDRLEVALPVKEATL